MPRPIVISILANASQANSTLNNTASLTGRVGGGFRKMGVPAVAALGAITLAAKSTIDSASALSENISRNRVVFGTQAGEIEKFAGRADKALGQSKTAALDAAATFGTIASKAGLSGSATADFSKQFVTLASDMASFNNTSPEEAVTAIGAAMRGESEPIRKYGVLLDDATLRNRALKLGLIDNVKQALTPQQKALAASKEILAQTTKAQGDFARTAGGAANKARIQAAQTENLKAKIGAGLLPAYIGLQGVALSVIGVMSKHTTTVKVLVGIIAALAVVVVAVNVAMKVAKAATAIYDAALVVHGAIQKRTAAAALGTRIQLALLSVQEKAAAAAQWLLNAAMSANPMALVVIAIIALVAAFVIAWKNSEKFRAIVTGAFNAVKSAVTKAVSTVVNFVRSHWRLLLVILTGPIGAAAVLIARHWSSITAAAGRMYTGVVGKVRSMVSYVAGIPGKIKAAIGHLGSLLYGAGKAIIQGLINGIQAMIGSLTSKLSSITNLIPDWKGPLDKDKRLLRPAGEAIMGGLIGGIAAKEAALRKRLQAITSTITSTGEGLSLGVDAARIVGSGDRVLLEVAARAGTTVNHFTIEVNVPVGASPVEVGRAIQEALDAYTNSGGRSKAA